MGPQVSMSIQNLSLTDLEKTEYFPSSQLPQQMVTSSLKIVGKYLLCIFAVVFQGPSLRGYDLLINQGVLSVNQHRYKTTRTPVIFH